MEHKHGASNVGLMKQALVACIDSPSKLNTGPKALIGDANTKMGQKLTQVQLFGSRCRQTNRTFLNMFLIVANSSPTT